MTPFTPEAFGKYYLVDKIATGGMAEIFKAKTFGHGGFENLVVIKRILPHIGENPEFIDMFIDEAKVTVALQHANIVRVYDFGKTLENYFIAMEYVDGKDVRSLLSKVSRERHAIPVPMCLYIAHEAAKGLHYAHTKANLQGEPYGIVHRDISPSNLLISYEGEVKVADFGIAKAKSNAYETRDGILKGKFEYMSPEQASGLPIDGRSDVFSLGIVLWEALTGRRLFKSESDTVTLRRIQAIDVQPPSKVHPRITAELDDVVMRALAPLDQRYASAGAFAAELRRVLAPATIDALSAEFRVFVRSVFADERAAERDRLEAHTAVAQRLHQRTPQPAEAWGAHTGSMKTPTFAGATRTAATIAVVPALLALLALGGFSLVLVGGAGAYWFVFLDGRFAVVEPPVEPSPVPAAPRLGSLEVAVMPSAELLFDGVRHDANDHHTLPDVPPGRYTLRLTAEGHEPYDTEVQVEPGLAVAIAQRLTPIAPQPAPIARPAPVARPAPAAEPTPVAALPGSLTVTLVGGGWANVYVDDVKLDRTAPLRGVALAPGRRVIRVENPATGLVYVEEVVVADGQAVTIRAAAR